MESLKGLVKEYSNGEVTIIWKPEKCIHSTICWHGLPDVFNPDIRPWINPQAASSLKIVEQVQKCPSGALSFFYNDKKNEEGDKIEMLKSEETTIEVIPSGPLLVTGNLHIVKKDGSIDLKQGQIALCRCGCTKNSPYCDGSHITVCFKG